MSCIELCDICGDKMPIFSITPLLEDEDGNLSSCCESCADKHFPGWEDDDEDSEDD